MECLGSSRISLLLIVDGDLTVVDNAVIVVGQVPVLDNHGGNSGNH